MEHRLHIFKDKAIGIGRSTWLIIGIVISFEKRARSVQDMIRIEKGEGKEGEVER